LVLEDSTGGVVSAVEAGINVVGITTSQTDEMLRENGCYRVIDDFRNFDIESIN
jgi:beta-phosphoglucomutase-like phosphatase (HAD superfamily)